MGDRRRRLLAERAAAEQAAATPRPVTRRERRLAEEAANLQPLPPAAPPPPPVEPPPVEPPPVEPPIEPRRGSLRRPVIKPPSKARRPAPPSPPPTAHDEDHDEAPPDLVPPPRPAQTAQIPVVTAPLNTGRPEGGADPGPPVLQQPFDELVKGDQQNVVPSPAARRRPPWWLWVALVVVVALVAFAVSRAVGGNGTGDGQQGAQDTTQHTLLLALTGADQNVTGAALFGTDRASTSALLVPSRLLVDVAGGGRGPMTDSLDTGDGAAGRAIADALDLRVDGTWVLTPAGLTSLVDAVGGITVDVTTAISSDVVAVPVGTAQRLNGAQAAAYAAYLASGEPEPARSARIAQVLSGLFAALPPATGDMSARLAAAADGSRSTLDQNDLAGRLVAIVKHAAAGEYAATVLPVTEIAAGDDTVLYGLDDAEAAPMLQSRFAGAMRSDGQEVVRVLVQNGVGTPGLGEQARDLLVDAGFRYVGGGNASTLGRDRTVVAIPSDSQQDRANGTAVATALGLGPDSLAVGRDAPTLADVVVVLGADFTAANRTS